MDVATIATVAAAVLAAIALALQIGGTILQKRKSKTLEQTSVALSLRLHTNYPATTFQVILKNLSSTLTLKDARLWIGMPHQSRLLFIHRGTWIGHHSLQIPYIVPLQELRFAPFMESGQVFRSTLEELLCSYHPAAIEVKPNSKEFLFKESIYPIRLRLGLSFYTNISNKHRFSYRDYDIFPLAPFWDQMTHWVLTDKSKDEIVN